MADNSIKITCAVYRTLMEFAERKKPFTTSELREKLGYDENSSEAQRMHALINNRKKDRIISVVSEGRKRNQSLQVKPDRKVDLQRLMNKAFKKSYTSGDKSSNTNTATLTTPKRVVYLEGRMKDLERRIKDLESESTAGKEEMSHLIELWG